MQRTCLSLQSAFQKKQKGEDRVDLLPFKQRGETSVSEISSPRLVTDLLLWYVLFFRITLLQRELPRLQEPQRELPLLRVPQRVLPLLQESQRVLPLLQESLP